MPIKRNAPIQKLDEAVEAAVEPSWRERRRTDAQRKKAKRDAARSRVHYDLPEELIERVKEIARKERIPESQMAAALLIAGLEARARGDLELRKVASRSPLYDFVLDLWEIPDDED